ncbi:hypothetical protein D0B54_12790 [Solimonas sp. K1W22B-7]|uniref:hypothetical protein n=1 Tax=Solimonas sp. K1W22B-7 TaxID=2303331 RepID=UPI000E33152C|nr:hypothetical protein [Solimonas sp. K1W22B-7]AXQ29515.1 hypothetical protein D0B54_12790 [Solimonas sp. K1W22B-7]
MSGPDRKAPDDRELEDFLEGRSPVSRAWREATRGESAPPELDSAVLEMAREESRKAAENPPALDRFRDRRWPLAMAAVLVLSLSTLLTIYEDPRARKDAMMLPPETAPAVPAVLPEIAAPAAAPAAMAESADESAAAPASAPAPERKAAAAAVARQDERALLQSQAGQSRQERTARGAGSAAPSAPVAAAAPAESGAMRDEREADAAPEPPPPAAVVPPLPAPAAASDKASAPSADRDGDGVPETRERREEYRASPTPKAKARGDAGMPAAGLARPQADTASEGLSRIRRLLAEGREEEARREFAIWRRTWPREPIPVDLSWLEAPSR